MAPVENRVKVYSLLTLTEPEVRKLIPDAIVAEPIMKWDIQKDVEDGINTVVIIDGKFAQLPSITPGEIMDTLRAGVRVYGASSMGAMRAAELHLFGMIGHGKIFEMIKRETFRDDYLGQLITPTRMDEMSLTYIDYYFNLKELEQRGLLRRKDVLKMEKAFGDLHYSLRSRSSWNNLVETLFERQPQIARHLRKVPSMGSQKKRDAISLLKLVRKDLDRIREQNSKLDALVNVARSQGFGGYWSSFSPD